MGIVGFRRLQGAEFEHLFEIGDRRYFETRTLSLRYRAGHRVKLEHPQAQIRRIDHHPFDSAATQGLREHALPLEHIGLGAGDDDFIVGNFQRKDVMALRERIRHDFGDRVDIDFQRVDADIRSWFQDQKSSRDHCGSHIPALQ